jgi:abequosyltransferase
MNPSTPRLSICIPTHNFGRFIGETLRSMLVQVQPGVEIVVLDSASTDDTPDVVGRLQADHECLRYVRAQEKGGIDRDMAEVVRLARGEYCWLFSADDLMCSGALSVVLAEIDERHDLYLCMHSNDSLEMQPIDDRHPVLDLHGDAVFQLADCDQQARYFSLAATTEAFFSFMGDLIVRRAAWATVALNEAFVGSCWAHVARMFEIASTGLAVKYLDRVLVRRRADNDSFASHGVVRRYALAIDGYRRLAERFWGADSVQAFHIRRVLRNEFRLRTLLNAKRLCALRPLAEDRQLLDELVTYLYCDPTPACRWRRAAFRAFPSVLLPAAHGLYARLRNDGR